MAGAEVWCCHVDIYRYIVVWNLRREYLSINSPNNLISVFEVGQWGLGAGRVQRWRLGRGMHKTLYVMYLVFVCD